MGCFPHNLQNDPEPALIHRTAPQTAHSDESTHGNGGQPSAQPQTVNQQTYTSPGSPPYQQPPISQPTMNEIWQPRLTKRPAESPLLHDHREDPKFKANLPTPPQLPEFVRRRLHAPDSGNPNPLTKQTIGSTTATDGKKLKGTKDVSLPKIKPKDGRKSQQERTLQSSFVLSSQQLSENSECTPDDDDDLFVLSTIPSKLKYFEVKHRPSPDHEMA